MLDKFDAVVNLPFFAYSKNWREVVRKRQDFMRRLRQVEFPQRSIIFGCGMGELVHFMLCRHIRAIRTGCSHLLVGIETFVDVIRDEAAIDVKRTILMNAFTIPLAKILVCSYMHPTTGTPLGHRYYPTLFDVLINLEHRADTHRIRTFNNIPFPLRCIDAHSVHPRSNIRLDESAVLVLLDSTLVACGMCDSEDEYWNRASELVQRISSHYVGSSVFIKLHPASPDAYLTRVRNMGVEVLDKTISAEEIYFYNRGLIHGVFSGASTSLITASWLGIPAYDCSVFLGYKQEFLNSYDAHFSHAPGIQHIHTLEDMSAVAFTSLNNHRPTPEQTKTSDSKAIWNYVLAEMERQLAFQ